VRFLIVAIVLLAASVASAGECPGGVCKASIRKAIATKEVKRTKSVVRDKLIKHHGHGHGKRISK
jgi:hypothetical protein